MTTKKNTFKAGDKVVCIDPGPASNRLTKGVTYTLLADHDPSDAFGLVPVTGDGGEVAYVSFYHRFRPLACAPAAPALKWEPIGNTGNSPSSCRLVVPGGTFYRIYDETHFVSDAGDYN